MKYLHILFALLVMGFTTLNAQVPSDFRIHNNQLYNVKLSTNWITIPYLSVNHGMGYATIYNGVFFKKESGGWIIRIKRIWSGDYAYEYVLLKNNPTFINAVSGQVLRNDRYIYVGTTEVDISERTSGITIKVYDWGLPNTPDNRVFLKTNKSNEISKPIR